MTLGVSAATLLSTMQAMYVFVVISAVLKLKLLHGI